MSSFEYLKTWGCGLNEYMEIKFARSYLSKSYFTLQDFQFPIRNQISLGKLGTMFKKLIDDGLLLIDPLLTNLTGVNHYKVTDKMTE